MPRIVDHAARRRALAEALWRVVQRDGIAQVSVRTVAAEAGTSPSALRHYFASQDELLGFALQSVVDRVLTRLRPLLPALRGRAGAAVILEQLLPLDPDRRNEVEVYLAFAARAHLEPALREIRDSAESATRAAVRHALQLMLQEDTAAEARTVKTEIESQTDLTYPLVDGLALHSTLWPDRYPPVHLRRVLGAHLDQIMAPERTGARPQ